MPEFSLQPKVLVNLSFLTEQLVFCVLSLGNRFEAASINFDRPKRERGISSGCPAGSSTQASRSDFHQGQGRTEKRRETNRN